MAGRPLDPKRWRRIAAILDRALELPAEEASALVAEACAGDPALEAEVGAFLAADGQAGGFLETPAVDAATFLDEATDPANDRLAAPVAERQLGPYRLIRAIGSGGMGVVYEARDVRLGRRVAVKLLPSEYSRDPTAKERFLREARSASALDHPNICTVHDIGESEDGRLFIVMTYYPGETLRERLERGPLPVAEARGVAIQLARALARAHEAGITHRDVKPANVILTERGEAKLVDFGIAKTAGDVGLTVTGGSLGTPAYMSPEQARGDPVDARTDVWSLGAVLYEMLAGRRPFPGSDPQAVIHAILERDPEPLEEARPETPAALARAVARALAKDPAERYRSMAELLADLESGTASRPRWPRRLPAGWRRIVAVASGAVAVAVIALWAGPKLLPGPPVARVALSVPAVSSVGENPDFAPVASEVVEAAVATLAALEGIEPLDPPPPDETAGSPTERLRAAEADEVLRPILDCRTDWCRVTFRRLRQPGGPVLATAGPFDVQAGVENAHQLAEAVRVHLQRAYPRHRLRSELPGDAVRPGDYASFVELKRRSDRGERLGVDDLGKLDRILGTSPDLLGAYLLAAGTAKNVPDPGRAMDYAERAQRLAPGDPRPLFSRFRIELAGGRLDEAGATIERLEDLSPGDVRVRTSRAELLEARDELQAARELRLEIVRRRPSWRNVLGLANLEVSLGDAETARRRLQGLVEEQPENLWVLESLAYLEVELGDLHRAAALYGELAGLRPGRAHLSNLGFVRFLLRDYRSAAVAYRRALDHEPDSLLTRFNLATAQQAQGDLAAAQALYRSLLGDLESAGGDPDARSSMIEAQCLARVGRHAEAAELTERVLERRPEDVQILHQAAQIHALLGERLSALYYVERCVEKGLRREWLEIPAFDSLRSDPEFRALLDSSRTGKAGSET